MQHNEILYNLNYVLSYSTLCEQCIMFSLISRLYNTFCISESLNTIFYYKIIFVHSQHTHTNPTGYLVLKSQIETLGLKISNLQIKKLSNLIQESQQVCF